MEVFKPDMSYIAQEAERIEKEAAERGDFPDLKFYKWKLGENHLRICPPWSAKGMIFKTQVQHFRLPPESKILPCYCGSWPDKTEDCFVCDALDKVLAMFPELNLKRQSASPQYQANVIDRTAENEGIQICRFTPATYNWITSQMSKKSVGDITDIEDGVDLTIDKKVTKRRDGQEQTKYVCSFVPRPSPIHKDDDMVEHFLKGIFDLDRVFAYPKEEKVADHSDYVERMVAYFIRKHRKSGVGAIDRGDNGSRNERKPRETPPSPKDDKPSSLEGMDPREHPGCFAGREEPEKHDDGSVGHRDDLEKCMICESELACIDATASRG